MHEITKKEEFITEEKLLKIKTRIKSLNLRTKITRLYLKEEAQGYIYYVLKYYHKKGKKKLYFEFPFYGFSPINNALNNIENNIYKF